MSLPARIFLVGLPGSGKSTWGREIANELNYQFIDLDELIEQREGISISQIFSEQGEDQFRKIETAALREVLPDKVVLATGGGTPCFNENMQWMNENGFTIYLARPLELIADRLKGASHRPLIEGDAFLKAQELYKIRKPFYEKAGMKSDHSEPCEVVAELHNLFD